MLTNPDPKHEVLDCALETPTRLPEVRAVLPLSGSFGARLHCYRDGCPLDEGVAPFLAESMPFCSVECAFAHAGHAVRAEILAGCPLGGIVVPARPREQLLRFGGHLTLAEFRGRAAQQLENPEERWCYYDAHPLDPGQAPEIFQGLPFCSGACVLRFLCDRTCVGSIIEYQVRVKYALTTPAPPAPLLRIYGGHMTVDEFRATRDFCFLYPAHCTGPARDTDSDVAQYSQLRPDWSPCALRRQRWIWEEKYHNQKVS